MWFKKLKESKLQKKVKIPEGLWVKCDNCKEIVYKKEIDKNLKVCPKCDYHFRISAKERIELLADAGSFVEFDADMCSRDPLNFKDSLTYPERLQANRNKSGLSEAVISGEAVINGFPVILTVMDFSFMGGSMGSVVGEKIARAAETALEKRVTLISIAS
ncbi:MAG: acetyl-CoA carboxylase carboxyltransferase subunit beta, partial [Nitrospirota bacterium]